MQKSVAAFLIWLLALVQPVEAQLPLTGVGLGSLSSGGGGGYSGPGDQGLTYSQFWGVIAVTSAARGNNVVNVCNQANTTCVDVATDATTGIAPNPSPGGTACTTSGGGNYCTIKIFYNQGSGGSGYDLTQTTAALRVNWIPAGNCQSLGASVSCAFSTLAGTPQYTTSSTLVQSQPFTMSYSARRDSGTGALTYMIYEQGNGVNVGGGSFGVADRAYAFAGANLNATATDATWKSVADLFNNPGGVTSSAVTVESTDTTGDVSSLTMNGAVRLFWGGGGNYWQGYMTYAGIVTATSTLTQRQNINTAAKTITGY